MSKGRIAALLSIICLLSLLPPSFSSFARKTVIGGGEGNTRFSTAEQDLLDLGLSVVYLDTADGDYIRSRLEYSECSMRIVLCESDGEYKNVYTTDSALPVKVKGRGNSTWNNGYPDGKANTLSGDTHTRKVPYNVKLSKKADLFGMGESKHWVLISNYMDRSFMRNKLICDLSGRMGMVYTKSVYVNLVLNGEYMGVYALTQKIDPDLFDGKVTDWEDLAEELAEGIAKYENLDSEQQKAIEDELCTDLSWVTSLKFRDYGIDLGDRYPYTGYLIEYDGYADEPSFFVTEHGVPLKVKNMDYIKSNPELFSYLTSYFHYFEEALYSDTFYNSAGKHYSEYLDMSSFVDYYILNALILNVEFGYKSMFMYINADGKLVLGPCWDYDWSSGNPFLRANGDYNQWYNDGRAGNNHWYHQVYSDPWFVALVRERWFEVLDLINEMIDSIDGIYDALEPTVEIEYEKFSSDPYERDFAWRTGGRSFFDECLQLKTFLTNRVEWMTDKFTERDPNIENRGLRSHDSFKIDITGSESALKSPQKDALQLSDLLSEDYQELKVRVRAAQDDSIALYLNGELIGEKSIRTVSGSATFTLPKDKFTPGVNVITAMKNTYGDGADVVYCSVGMPGTKSFIPSANDSEKRREDAGPEEIINGLVPERIPVKTEKTMSVWLVAGISAGIIAVCSALSVTLALSGILQKKQKKQK